MRLCCTWRAGLAALALLATPVAACAAGDAPRGAGASMSVGSPAWHTLLALPLRPGEPPPLDAADLLERHGLGAEAGQLRRQLLVHHLQRSAASAPASPPAMAATHLRDVWASAAQGPASAPGLRQAYEAALDAHLKAEPLAATDRNLNITGWQSLGDRFGLWTDPRRGRVAAFVNVSHTLDLRVDADDLRLRLAAGEADVSLRCRQPFGGAGLPAGPTRVWHCEGDMADVNAMKALRAADPIDLHWQAPAVQDDARSVAAMVARFAPTVTPGVVALATKLQACTQSLRCDQAIVAPPRTIACNGGADCRRDREAAATARPAAEPQRPPPAARAEPRAWDEPRRQDPDERPGTTWWVVLVFGSVATKIGAFLAALSLYVYVRRAAGALPASLAVGAIGGLATVAIAVEAMVASSWDRLLGLMASGGVGAATVALLSIAPAVYRSIFMTGRTRPRDELPSMPLLDELID